MDFLKIIAFILIILICLSIDSRLSYIEETLEIIKYSNMQIIKFQTESNEDYE